MTAPAGEPEVKPHNPEPTPDPPPPPQDSPRDPEPDRVGILEKRMDDAEAILAALTSTPDSNPAGKPWTHKRVF